MVSEGTLCWSQNVMYLGDWRMFQVQDGGRGHGGRKPGISKDGDERSRACGEIKGE